MARVVNAVHAVWAHGSKPMGGTFLTWLPRELNQAADYLTHVARRRPFRNKGWLATPAALERARGAPLVAWVDAGESEDGVGIGVALANARSREVLTYAALWSPQSGDINDEEAKASEWALQAMLRLRRGEAQELRHEWKNEMSSGDRARAAEVLVWPGERGGMGPEDANVFSF